MAVHSSTSSSEQGSNVRRFAARALCLAALAATSLGLLSFACRSMRQRMGADPVFCFDHHLTTLVAGDSHPQSAFDPLEWRGLVNLCEGQEGYFFTYYKLRFFLERNPHIDRVILGFSYHNLSRGYQERFVTHPDEARRILERYFILLDDEGIVELRRLEVERDAYYLNLLKFRYGLPIQVYRDKDLLRHAMHLPLRPSDVAFFGRGYYRGSYSRIDDEQIGAKARYYFLDEGGSYSGLSNVALKYLEKLIRLSEARRVQLYLYNGPLHPKFKRLVPMRAIADLERIKDDVLGAFPHVHYLDLVDEPLPNESFGDGDHVNRDGAKVVTARVRRLVLQE